MKSWNSHAWYVTGILSALFVGSISVHWDSIKDLPGIISFALGLSSLLLAVFAIIQSITSGNSAESSLSAVRESSIGVQTALSEISSVTKELRSVSGNMLQSSEASRSEMIELRKEVLAKGSLSEQSPIEPDTSLSQPEKPTLSKIEFYQERMTYGVAGALYLAIRSYQNKKRFNIVEVFPGDKATSYESGVLAGLRSVKFLGWKKEGKYTTIVQLNGNVESLIKYIEEAEFNKVTNEELLIRLALIDKYFADQTLDNI